MKKPVMFGLIVGSIAGGTFTAWRIYSQLAKKEEAERKVKEDRKYVDITEVVNARNNGAETPVTPSTWRDDAVTFKTKGKATEVLEALNNIILCNKIVNVSEFYRAAGKDIPEGTNNKHWLDLASAEIIKSGNKWVIVFPMYIDTKEA